MNMDKSTRNRVIPETDVKISADIGIIGRSSISFFFEPKIKPI